MLVDYPPVIFILLRLIFSINFDSNYFRSSLVVSAGSLLINRKVSPAQDSAQVYPTKSLDQPISTQLAFTYSNSTMETAEQCVKSAHKVKTKNTRTTSLALFWCLYC